MQFSITSAGGILQHREEYVGVCISQQWRAFHQSDCHCQSTMCENRILTAYSLFFLIFPSLLNYCILNFSECKTVLYTHTHTNC